MCVQEFQQPELKRAPLAELCLQAKVVAPAVPVATFLSGAVDPPVPQAIDSAVSLLMDIGAFEEVVSSGAMRKADPAGPSALRAAPEQPGKRTLTSLTAMKQLGALDDDSDDSGSDSDGELTLCRPASAQPGRLQRSADASLLQHDGTTTEALTVLGSHLAALPLEPQLGKLLLWGALFGCVDAMLSIACAMSYRCAPAVRL